VRDGQDEVVSIEIIARYLNLSEPIALQWMTNNGERF